MAHTMERNQVFFERAGKVMPFGVSSNFRWWGEGENIGVSRAKGTYLWDFDGNRYIDYQLGFGPIILGHGHPAVVERVSRAIQQGTIFALTHEYEVKVAERIVEMCPGIDKVRFANSGSEATMHALRIARSHTGREKILKFEGQYHGMYDYVLFSTASSPVAAMGHERSPIPVASSSGIPRAIRDLIVMVSFNDLENLERIVKQQWGDIAAILVEPMLGNLASTMPEDGFLELIRSLCDEYGIVMIMDEVKTGFRVAPGGAQELFRVQADMATYAKVMGNGFPIAAIGGSDEVMASVGPGRTSQGGTYCGNVVGTAAADITLEIIAEGDALQSIDARGRALMEGISSILTDFDLAHHMTGVPSMFGIAFSEELPKNQRAWANDADIDFYNAIMAEMIPRGVLPCPDNGEPWFLCAALSEKDVAETLNVFEDAVRAVIGK